MRRRFVFLPAITLIGVGLMLAGGPACAGADKPAGDNGPTFGSRTDKPDGSSALTIGRRLPTVWDTKIGTDLSLAAPENFTAADNFMAHDAPERSTGSVWGNLTMPGVAPLGFDKTSIEARLDAGKDQGRLGATLSRSLPLDPNVSVTLQNNYAVTQMLATAAPLPPPPLSARPSTTTPLPSTMEPSLSAGETLLFNVNPSGTTFSAGAVSSIGDAQWHSKFSVEQTLLGPLKLTTSVEDAGTAASRKTIKAGFKTVW